MKNHVSVSNVGSHLCSSFNGSLLQLYSDVIKRRCWLMPEVSILKLTSIVCVITFATGCSSISTFISPPTTVVTNSGAFELVSGSEDFIHVIARSDKFCRLSPPGDVMSSSDSLSGEGDALSSGVTVSSQNLGSSAYLVSEVMYRVCELSINYDLNKEEAKFIFIKGLEAVSDISGNPTKISAQVTTPKP